MQTPVLSQVMGSTGPLVGYGDGAPAPTPTHSQYGAMVPPTPTTTMATITPPSTRIRTAIPSYQNYTIGTPSAAAQVGSGYPVFQPAGWALSFDPNLYTVDSSRAICPDPAYCYHSGTSPERPGSDGESTSDGGNAAPSWRIASDGGGLPAQDLAPVPGVPTPGGPPLSNHAGYGPPQAPLSYGYGNAYGPAPGQRHFGMPSTIKNTIRMIQPFYSDSASVDKARTFWNAFVRATEGLDDALRLNPSPDDITLKDDEAFEGMSAEVWGDLISSLCDAAQCYDAEMRYQYFLSGLRNKEWRAVLATTMVNSIPHAVAVLLFKNMHLPIDDDSEFAEEVATKPASESSMMQQMLTMMQQTQNLLVQQQQQHMARPPRSPRQSMAIAAAYDQPELPEQLNASPRAASRSAMPETPFRGDQTRTRYVHPGRASGLRQVPQPGV
ncbi:unnamed protein product [Phytophthora fragariaefolia]|uniref:Unnamed protein product n=1 Tax=Phytophthora fragariaefolia TaxID=1490495 RepID=A0A9W6XU53_9STRA|nr:unnamed protein product [Phytophthora fragariaefolia]